MKHSFDSVLRKRILLSVGGVLIGGVSVGLFRTAELGVDPFQSLMSGLEAVVPISFGTLYVIVNALLLLVSLIFDRRKIGLATLINLTLLGYVVEFSEGLFRRLLPALKRWRRRPTPSGLGARPPAPRPEDACTASRKMPSAERRPFWRLSRAKGASP